MAIISVEPDDNETELDTIKVESDGIESDCIEVDVMWISKLQTRC